jgi:hypothetical protein
MTSFFNLKKKSCLKVLKSSFLMYLISQQNIGIQQIFFFKIRQQNVRNSSKNVRNYKNCSIVIPHLKKKSNFFKNLILEKIKEEDVLRERRNKVLNKKYETKQSSISQTNKAYSLSDNAISQFNQTSVNDDAKAAKIAPLPLPDLVDFKSYLDAERKIDVTVTAIATPFAFWAQLCQNQKDLSKLLKEMNNFYKTIDIRLNFVI